jgi:hypothetical protein
MSWMEDVLAPDLGQAVERDGERMRMLMDKVGGWTAIGEYR